MKELLKNIIAHTKSSRFVVIVLVLILSFVGAIIKMIWVGFPYIPFAGIINSLSLGTWILKTFEPGARERRLSRASIEEHEKAIASEVEGEEHI